MIQHDNIRREPGGVGHDHAVPVVTSPRLAGALGRAFALLAIVTPLWACSGSPTAPDTTPLANPAGAPAAPPATLSNTACVVSSPTTIIAEDVDTPTESLTDGINIIFDTISLTAAVSDEPSSDPNRLLFLDVDVFRPSGFAIEQGAGTGWDIISDSFPSVNIAEGVDAGSGSYTMRTERTGSGDQYDVALTVTVSPTADGVSMTVSGLQACPI